MFAFVENLICHCVWNVHLFDPVSVLLARRHISYKQFAKYNYHIWNRKQAKPSKQSTGTEESQKIDCQIVRTI